MKVGVKDACRNRYPDEVVDQGPGKVLAHDAYGATGESDGYCDGTWLAPQQDHVPGFARQVGPGSHCDSGVGLRQGGSIVDAVTHHGYPLAALLQLANLFHLTCGQEFGVDVADTRFQRDCFGGCPAIAGEHLHFHPGAGERSDQGCSTWPQSVLRLEKTGELTING